jgi:hypothetical protein
MSQFSNGLARPVGLEQGEHAAARDLQVDAREGLDAVSMGRVAAELKAAPMSLYRRVWLLKKS